MQIIHILRNDAYFVLLFQLCQKLVRMVWLHIQQFFPPLIIESQHFCPVFAVALYGGQFLHIDFCPQPIFVPERRKSTFRTDASAS